jgi:hypothetical protein
MSMNMENSVIENNRSSMKSGLEEGFKQEPPSVRSVIDGAILGMLMTELEKDLDGTPLPLSVGQQFGKWKVISLKYHNPRGDEPYLLLRCECGSLKTRPQLIIVSGQSTSCGCS